MRYPLGFILHFISMVSVITGVAWCEGPKSRLLRHAMYGLTILACIGLPVLALWLTSTTVMAVEVDYE